MARQFSVVWHPLFWLDVVLACILDEQTLKHPPWTSEQANFSGILYGPKIACIGTIVCGFSSTIRSPIGNRGSKIGGELTQV